MAMKYDYHEKQYLGYNRFGIIRRMVIALFCLVFYATSQVDDQTKNVFFLLAIVVLVLSLISLLIQHLETRLEGSKLTLIGPVSFKKVELELKDLKSLEIKPYSRFLLNRPMFNLHKRNSIRFFTHGNWCVEFETKNGELITLGTQRPQGLYEILSKFLASTTPEKVS